MTKRTNIMKDGEVSGYNPDADGDLYKVTDFSRDFSYLAEKITSALKFISNSPSSNFQIIYGGIVSDSGAGQIDISEGVAMGKDVYGNIAFVTVPALSNVSLPSGWNDNRQIWVRGKHDYKLDTVTGTRQHFNGEYYNYVVEDSYLGESNSDDLFVDADPSGAAVIWGSFKMNGTTYADQGVRSSSFKIPKTLIESSTETGIVLDFTGKTLPSGWVYASGKTIGNVSSGGTERANADCEALFTLYFDDYTDAELPIQDSAGAGTTRAAQTDAATAWAANCRMTIPDFRGRVSVGRDDMGGTAANRVTVLASGIAGATMLNSGGSETHTLITAEMPAHSHGITDPGHSHRTVHAYASGPSDEIQFNYTYGNASSYIGIESHVWTTGITINNTGSGNAHKNMQPSIIVNKLIKL